MKTLLTSSIVAAVLGFATAGFAQADFGRDPTGESAFYKVDRNSARTTGMIQSGEMTASVTEHREDTKDYQVKIDYTFRIQFMGTRSGTQYVSVPEAYFTDEFLANLRATGHYESEQFKIDHLGYADASNMDGHSYPHCDKIKIYDIKQQSLPALAWLTHELLAYAPSDQIENLVIVAHIAPGQPVLGAVKLDVSGKYSGMNVKAGADYQAP